MITIHQPVGKIRSNLVFFLIGLSAAPALPQTEMTGVSQYFPGSELGDYFGWPISGDESVMVVGSVFDSHENGMNAGSIKIYEKTESGWNFTQELFPPPGSDRAKFGTLAYWKGILAVGAPGLENSKETGKGAVFIYQKQNSEWLQTARIDPPPNNGERYFGKSLWMGDDLLFVGCPAISSSPGLNGIAFLYRKTDDVWQLSSRLEPDVEESVNYGFSLACNGSFIAVGDPSSDAIQSYRKGRVFLYKRENNEWIQAAKLEPDFAHYGENYRFGESVAMNSTQLAITYPDYQRYKRTHYADPTNLEDGIVVLFSLTPSTLLERTLLKSRLNESRYGDSLFMNENLLLVGSTNYNVQDKTFNPYFWSSRGSVFVYKNVLNSWEEIISLKPPENSTLGGFGLSVSLNGKTVWVGAPYARNDQGDSTGCLFSFDLPDDAVQKLVFHDPTPAYDPMGPLYLNQILYDETPELNTGYGKAVECDGYTLMISDPDDGELFVYERENEKWVLRQVLTSPLVNMSNFGSSIALDGNQAIVNGFLFERENGKWTFRQTVESLLNPPRTLSIHTSYDLQGDTLAISTWSDQFQSLVIILEKHDGAWRLVNEFSFKYGYIDYSEQSPFDCNIDLDGNTIMVGIRNPFQNFAPTVWVFEKLNGTWIDQSSLNSYFSKNILGITLKEDMAIVRAADAVAKVFRRANGQWYFTQGYEKQNAPAVYPYGNTIELDGNRMAIGADKIDSVYFYGFQDSFWQLFYRLSINNIFTFSTRLLPSPLFGKAVCLNGNQVFISAPEIHHYFGRNAVFYFEIQRVGVPTPTPIPVPVLSPTPTPSNVEIPIETNVSIPNAP